MSRTINHVVSRKGDIDHIAIGPDGVIVGAGLNVVAGERLRAELSQLGDAHLTSDGIDEVYKKLKMWVERKEGWNGDRAAPQRPTLAQLANRWWLRSLFGLAGAYVSILALRLGWWYFAAAAAATHLFFGRLGHAVQVRPVQPLRARLRERHDQRELRAQ